VFENDARFAGALGAGGADEILVEDVEHAAAGETGDVGGVEEAEDERRENAVDGLIPAGGVDPAEVYPKKQDKERTEDEGGTQMPIIAVEDAR
jgi:hypothetical protein